MEQLGKKSQLVYDYIIECMSEGLPPTVREICNELGFKSTSTAHKYLVELEKLGYIARESGLNRNIKINADRVLHVPLVGTVAAGVPITAIENIEKYIPFSGKNYGQGDLFALNVQGDSMVEIGILNGDIVVTEKTPYAEDGQIVVAMINEEATVKRFYKTKTGYVLKAENKNFPDIECGESLDILGKVIACIRTYE